MPVDLKEYKICVFVCIAWLISVSFVFKGIPLYKHVSALAGKGDVILPVPVSAMNSYS